MDDNYDEDADLWAGPKGGDGEGGGCDEMMQDPAEVPLC